MSELRDSLNKLIREVLGDFPQGFNAGVVAGVPGWAGDMAYLVQEYPRALLTDTPLRPPVEYAGTTDSIAKAAGYEIPGTLSGQLGAAVGGLLSPGPGDLAKFAPLLSAIPFWHGSPHKFDAFDLSKMGSGEGAQAYGWGAYGAEAPDTAVSYKRSNMFGVQNAFKDTGGELPQIDSVEIGGLTIGGLASGRAVLLDAGPTANLGMSGGPHGYPTGVDAPLIDPAGVMSISAPSRAMIKDAIPGISDADADAIRFLVYAKGDGEKAASLLAAKGLDEAAQKAKDSAPGFRISGVTEGSGHLYRGEYTWPDPAKEAATPLTGEDLLQWDKPLSEQSPAIQELARSVGVGKAVGPTKVKLKAFIEGTESPERGIVATGEDLYRALSDYGSESAEGSRALQAVGIPGIRYLDGQSRDGGSGTYNYVMFDDKGIKLLERNGKPIGGLLDKKR